MVYYNILGIFIIRGVGGFIIRGRGVGSEAFPKLPSSIGTAVNGFRELPGAQSEAAPAIEP